MVGVLVTARDELTKAIAYWLPTTMQGPDDWAHDRAGQISNELWAAGWRKMPSAAKINRAFDTWLADDSEQTLADRILALMDGDNK